MSSAAYIALFFLTISKVYCSVRGDFEPVTLGNVLRKFQHLQNADAKNIDASSEMDDYEKSLYRLYDEYPYQLNEIAKESHSLAFNYILQRVWVVHQYFANHSTQGSINFVVGGLKVLKESRENIFEITSKSILDQVIEILKSFGLGPGDQGRNEESLKLINSMMIIAKEFGSKIPNLKERQTILTQFKTVKFIIENLTIDYQNSSIDYSSFMGVFYEIKSLLIGNSKDGILNEKIRKLKSLFKVYASLIKKSQCYLIFDFYPAEELFYQVILADSLFENTFLFPNGKCFVLKTFYNTHGHPFYSRFGKLILGKTATKSLSIEMRFFAKLTNLLRFRENYDLLWNSGYSEYLSDYQLWIYMGLSKIEYYLKSFTKI
jgi:hypothetical protein